MFTKKVTDDDNFMELSSPAQALYLHLTMSADDDGFCNQVSLSMFKAHASIQDLQVLLEKRYIYQFENGVIVIKHWRMANALRKDRYTPTAFKEELARLGIKENGSYTWLPDGCQVVAERLPQDSIGKDRVEEESEEEESEEEDSIETIKRIVDYLNMVCGTNYRYQTANTKKHIRARLSEGFTYEDFQKVIDKKSAEWTGTTMEKFLRPDTLFGSKFESYLNQNIVKDKQGNSKSGGIDWDSV